MIRKILGRTGLEVTQLGFGSMGIRGPKTWGVRVISEEAADEILNCVLDAGINFIDTSPDYGISERRIGQTISSRRSEFYLATKCGCVTTQHEDHLEIDHVWKKEVVQRNIETSERHTAARRLGRHESPGKWLPRLQRRVDQPLAILESKVLMADTRRTALGPVRHRQVEVHDIAAASFVLSQLGLVHDGCRGDVRAHQNTADADLKVALGVRIANDGA